MKRSPVREGYSPRAAGGLRRAWLLAFLVGHAGVARAAEPAGRPPSPAEAAATWREEKKCALNALYLLLKLHHRPVPYDDLGRRLAVTSRGTSLAEVRRCAGTLGLPARVVRTTPESLARRRLPAIAHTEEEEGTTGHYVVVLAVDEGGVETIDGTTAILKVVPMDEFRRRWTGFLLEVEGPSWRPLVPAAALLAAALAAALLIVEWRRGRNAEPAGAFA